MQKATFQCKKGNGKHIRGKVVPLLWWWWNWLDPEVLRYLEWLQRWVEGRTSLFQHSNNNGEKRWRQAKAPTDVKHGTTFRLNDWSEVHFIVLLLDKKKSNWNEHCIKWMGKHDDKTWMRAGGERRHSIQSSWKKFTAHKKVNRREKC